MKIFISYARDSYDDTQTAKRLYRDLEKYGHEPWLDSKNLLPGQQWKSAIAEAIRSSRFFITILSNHSVNKKGFVQRELREALEVIDEMTEDDVFLIPVRIDECKPRIRKLDEINWVDLFPDYQEGLEKILAALEIYGSDGSQSEPDTAPPIDLDERITGVMPLLQAPLKTPAQSRPAPAPPTPAPPTPAPPTPAPPTPAPPAPVPPPLPPPPGGEALGISTVAHENSVPPRAGNSPDPDGDLENAYYQWIRSWFNGRNLLARLNYKIVSFAILSPILLFKMLIIPMLASRALEIFAEGHDVDVKVEDWSADVLDLKATAHKITIFARGPYAEEELLKADAIVVDLSLWRRLRSGSWIHQVQVQDPDVYLERSLAGERWNWHELASGDGSSGGIDSSSDTVQFSLSQLAIEGMSLEWVENLPGGSTGNIKREMKATLHVDDVGLQASNLQGPVDPRPHPSQITLKARTGAGTIAIDGKANLFYRSAPEKGDSTSGGARRAWTPTLKASIYLENVGANTFYSLTPDAAIMPESGTLSGTIQLELANNKVTCFADLTLQNVTFVVNASSPWVGSRARQVERELAGYSVSGPRRFACGGPLANGGFRPFQSFLSNVTSAGIDKTPRSVRAVADYERNRYTEEPAESTDLDEFIEDLQESNPEGMKWLKRINKARGLFR